MSLSKFCLDFCCGGVEQVLFFQRCLVFRILPEVTFFHCLADFFRILRDLHFEYVPQLFLFLAVTAPCNQQSTGYRLFFIFPGKMKIGEFVPDVLHYLDLHRWIEFLHVFYQGIETSGRFFIRGNQILPQLLVFKEVILYLSVHFTVEAYISAIVDFSIRNVQQMDEADQNFFHSNIKFLKPLFIRQITRQPDKSFSVIAIMTDEVPKHSFNNVNPFGRDQFVDDEPAQVKAE